METLAPPELHLLPELDTRGDWHRSRNAAIGSLGFHAVAILFLITIRTGPLPVVEPRRLFVHHITPLFIPPDLTQKAPNKEPIKKELTIAAIAPHPAIKAPAPPRQIPMPPAQPQAAQRRVEIEAPKIEAAVPNLTVAQIPKTVALPPPPSTAPKIALEDVNPQRNATPGKPSGAIALPNTSIADAVRSVTRPSSLSGITVVDPDERPGALGLNLPPSAGRPHSSLELKSDPMGVDFRGYMTQTLAAVRRSWFAVYPEAARLGQRGQVSVQFAITKVGGVTKIVFTAETGSRPLDQAAVAAISGAIPLPPLPPEFKGDRIVLQMTFSYNMPR